MTRTCDICGREYEAKRSDSRTCSAVCRKRRARGAASPADADSALVAAVRIELELAGKVGTRLGQQALIIAARMSGVQTPAGVSALSRELDRVMAAAIGGGSNAASPVPGAGDVIDELRARRDAKKGAQ